MQKLPPACLMTLKPRNFAFKVLQKVLQDVILRYKFFSAIKAIE